MRRKVAVLVALTVLLISCGGGGGGESDSGITPPAQSLVGSYNAIGYDRDGVPQPAPSNSMEIGQTQILVEGTTNPGDSFLIGTTCTYALHSDAMGKRLSAQSPGVAAYYFFYAPDGLQLTTWLQVNNVTTTVRWEKASDSTTLH